MRPNTGKEKNLAAATSGLCVTFVVGSFFISCWVDGTDTSCGWCKTPCWPLPTPHPLAVSLPLLPLTCHTPPTEASTAGACGGRTFWCNCCCCWTLTRFFMLCWSFWCACCCGMTWRITGWYIAGCGSTVLRLTIVAIALPCGGSDNDWEPSPAIKNSKCYHYEVSPACEAIINLMS